LVAPVGYERAILVDGADNRDENLVGVLLNMTLEGIEEFKVSQLSVRCRRSKTRRGAVVSITTVGDERLARQRFSSSATRR